MDAPHGFVGGFEIAGKRRRVEKGRPVPVANELLTQGGQAAGIAGQAKRKSLVTLSESAINSGMPAALSKLPATRDGNVSPGKVSTGKPTHSASVAVVWAL